MGWRVAGLMFRLPPRTASGWVGSKAGPTFNPVVHRPPRYSRNVLSKASQLVGDVRGQASAGVSEIVGVSGIAVAPGDVAVLQLGALTLGRRTV